MLLEELYTPLENVFLDCSYAYRQGRNIQQAIQHLFGYYQYQPKWVIKADIENFFGNVCWALLLSALEKLQLEPIVLQLLKQQLQAGIVINGKTSYPEKGLLQGGVLSGALANLYLTEFDRKCLQQGINLVRYGDDFAIVCNSWVEANLILDKISTWLGNLYLTLQPEKTQIYLPEDEFIFLGYRFAKGEIFAPPPPVIPTPGEWLVNDSGTPYFRPKKGAAKFVSRRPKACDISKSSKLPTAPISHLWQESMSTLYVTDQGSFISVKNQQFQVFSQRELKIKIPVVRVSYIVIFGCCNISHGAIKMALKRQNSIIYLSQRGWYFGKVESQGMPKVEYLIRQVECSLNPEFIRKQAEAIVRGKLHNSRIILMRLNRRRPTEIAEEAIEDIKQLMELLPLAESTDALRGYEGKAAAIYFPALGSLFTGTFTFSKRTKRPPTDPINSLMSLGYAILSQQVSSFVQATGLHVNFGNLHVPRDNNPALALDLMEEFRAPIVDSFVAYLINKNIFTQEDFHSPDEAGGVYLYPDKIKIYLKHWEEKLQTEVTHPHTGYKVAYRRCIELQMREYVACLMGEVDVYRPMIWEK